MEFALLTLTTRDLGSVNLECLIYTTYTGSQRAMSEGGSDKGKKTKAGRILGKLSQREERGGKQERKHQCVRAGNPV